MLNKEKTYSFRSKINSLKFVSLLFILSSFGFGTQAQAADCGDVSIANMNWASAEIVASLSKFILEEGYDCNTTMVPTATVPGITSLVNKGEPNFVPEAWENSIKTVIEKGVNSGKVVQLGDIFSSGGNEMWLVPKYFADKHNIRTMEDVKSNYKLFKDPEKPSKGRFHNCPGGWACRIVNNNLFSAYGLSGDFTNFDSGSGEGLKTSLAKAYTRKEAWFGYYWGPTAILGKYDMQVIGLNPSDPKGHECNTKENCENPHAGSYPRSVVTKLATKELLDRNSEVTVFLAKFEVPNEVLNSVLAWREDSQATADESAAYFMRKFPAVWQRWLSESALSKIQKAL